MSWTCSFGVDDSSVSNWWGSCLDAARDAGGFRRSQIQGYTFRYTQHVFVRLKLIYLLFQADVGQDEDIEEARQKAIKLGAKKVDGMW